MLRMTMVTAVAVLALAGEAAAGCFATIGMSVPPSRLDVVER